MTKPIEPGCICILVKINNPRYIRYTGTIATVIGRMDNPIGMIHAELKGYNPNALWIIDIIPEGRTKQAYCTEECLKRIDDGDLTEEELIAEDELTNDCGHELEQEVI